MFVAPFPRMPECPRRTTQVEVRPFVVPKPGVSVQYDWVPAPPRHVPPRPLYFTAINVYGRHGGARWVWLSDLMHAQAPGMAEFLMQPFQPDAVTYPEVAAWLVEWGLSPQARFWEVGARQSLYLGLWDIELHGFSRVEGWDGT